LHFVDTSRLDLFPRVCNDVCGSSLSPLAPLVTLDLPVPPTAADLLSEAQLRAAIVQHLPIVREVIERLGIYKTISRILPHDGRMRVSDADCVTLMILNILHGRVALYKMNEWLESADIGVVLGDDCPADAFYDDRLAGTLDRIFEVGIDDVLSEVVLAYLRSDSCPSEYSAHTDTTSIKLYGAYDTEIREGAPRPDFGHSKDHRPDLKQLVYGMTLQGAVGVPMCVSMFDGNTADPKVNRYHIDRLAGLLPPEHDVTLVHDCKLFDPMSLGQVLDSSFHFLTLVPRSYRLRHVLVVWAASTHPQLPELAREPGRTKADPDRVYRGVSTTAPFTVCGPESGEQTRELRFLVVESPQLAAAFEAGLDEKLAKDRAGYEKAVAKLGRSVFDCEEDAASAIDKLAPPSFHQATVTIRREIVTLRRARRGRPKTGEEAPTHTIYRAELTALEIDKDLVDNARLHARHFVLATDHLDRDAWPDERILEEYRHQHIVEGHTGFRWLKGPAAVAPMFLKSPHRIAALGLVFILALMVRNYIQWALRDRLAEQDEHLPNMNDQPTQKPTTESAFRLFTHVSVVLVVTSGTVVRRIIQGTTPHTRKVLQLLNMPADLLTRPRLKSRYASG